MSEYIVQVEGQMPDTIYERELTEIVRCGDCKYYDIAGPWCFEPSKVYIDEYGLEVCATVRPDGFCAWGERKDDGHSEHTAR